MAHHATAPHAAAHQLGGAPARTIGQGHCLTTELSPARCPETAPTPPRGQSTGAALRTAAPALRSGPPAPFASHVSAAGAAVIAPDPLLPRCRPRRHPGVATLAL